MSSPILDICAVGYLRVSGATQAQEDRGGLPRQREALENYAKAQGFRITQWFVEAYTGTDLENRPAFQEMRTQLIAGSVKIVLIEKLDRLARDLMISEAIIADFKKNGIELRSATVGEEDLGSKEPTRKFIRQMLAAVAEFDRSMLVARMKDGKARARARGVRCGGRSAYGMHRNHPGERAILDRVFHLRRMGMNAAKIAETLNAEKVCTRSGGLWYAMQISRIIAGAPKTTQEKQS